MFPQDIQLTDLLTFFLFIDLVVMVVVGIYTFKSRHKKGTTEQLLEEIRDVLRQNPNGCAEKLTSKSAEKTESTKSQEELVKEKLRAINAKTEPKQEVPMPIDRERIYYEIEESTEPNNDESSDLNLVKNALKDGPVIKPLLKMPKYIDELVNRSRQNESPTDQTEVATSSNSTVPPPPPPTSTQTASTKKDEQQERD
jgi:hypothetical protein